MSADKTRSRFRQYSYMSIVNIVICIRESRCNLRNVAEIFSMMLFNPVAFYISFIHEASRALSVMDLWEAVKIRKA